MLLPSAARELLDVEATQYLKISSFYCIFDDSKRGVTEVYMVITIYPKNKCYRHSEGDKMTSA